MTTGVQADVQIACEVSDMPSKSEIEDWISRAIGATETARERSLEVSIRIVDEAESQQLNLKYRDQDKPTNVLAFPVSLPDIDAWPDGIAMPLGDLVICAPVVEREAAEQGKKPAGHWGHMLVHGTLHLLGFDHVTEAQAETMEALEIRILQGCGITNPYEDN